MELSSKEKEMANFDFAALTAQNETAKTNIANATSADDIKSEICNVWAKIGKYVKMGEVIPVVGKFITILAELLDSLCGA